MVQPISDGLGYEYDEDGNIVGYSNPAPHPAQPSVPATPERNASGLIPVFPRGSGYTDEELASMAPSDRAMKASLEEKTVGDQIADEVAAIHAPESPEDAAARGAVESGWNASYQPGEEPWMDPNPTAGGGAPEGPAGRMPVVPNVYHIPGSRGQWVPEHEQHVKRAVEAELGVPIPEEAQGLYREANDIHREDAALARLEAAKEAGRIEAAKRQGALEVEQQAIKTQQRLAEEQQAEYQRYRQHYEAAEIDPSRVWNNKSTMQKILATIGMAFGGFAATVKGGPNFALQLLQSEINEDINAQRENRAAIKASLDSLGVKHQQEDADVDLERVKRLKAVEMMAEQQLAAMGVDDKTMGAAHAELLAKIREAQADLIDKAALRAAGKVVEQNQFGTIEGQYRGGSAGRDVLTNPGEVYMTAYETAKAGGASELEAQAKAEKTLAAYNMKPADIASVATMVHSSLPLPTSGGENGINASNKETQMDLLSNFIPTNNQGDGYWIPGLNDVGRRAIKTHLYQIDKVISITNELQRLMDEYGTRENFTSEARAKMDVLQSHLMAANNYLIKTDSMVATEMPMIQKATGEPGAIWTLNSDVKVRTAQEQARRYRDIYLAEQNGYPARANPKGQRTPGGWLPSIEVTGGTPVAPGQDEAVVGGNTRNNR